MGLAVMMGVQTPAMAAETSQESTTQETMLEPQTEESETAQMEIAESQAEEIETTQVEIAESQAAEIETTQVEITESQTAESQIAEAETEQATTTEYQAEEVNATETQTEETAISTENAESQVEEASEQVGQTEQETEAEVEAEIAVLAAEEDGWHQNDDGSRYYVKDGEILKDCVEKIDDSYYGFNWNGVMYADDDFSIWNEETQMADFYRAKADGSLYVNEWYILGEWSKCYYGADGRRYSGLQTIDGKQYYFSEAGWLCKNQNVSTRDGKYYFCDEEGIATEQTLANNDWTEIDGKRYYVKDGELLKSCVEKIGDFYYGFDYKGIMYANRTFDIWNAETQKNDYYRAKADGSLYVNEWYIPNEWSKYYYGADGKGYVGLQTVDGNQYYFEDNGRLCINTAVTSEDGRAYACDEEGIATELINNDWAEIDGKRYYVKDGQILKECIEKIGDSYYGFDDNGVMYADCEFSIWNEEAQKSDDYRAKANGRLYANEWYKDGETKYYYGADARRCSGLQIIEGKQYYFDESGWLYTNTTVTIDDKLYLCDEDGVVTELVNNDWTEVNGEYYYVKDGQTLKECIEKIGDFYYGFGWKGAMYADCEFSIWNEETQESHYYRAKADGSLYVNEWYDGGDEKYYYGADAEAYTDLQTIEGKQYYFDKYGSLYQDTIIRAEDGSQYYCDTDGIATKLPETGWAEMGGKYYYIKDGEFLKKCVEKIGDSYYGFDYNGVMYSDTEIFIWNNETQKQEAYRAKANGRLYANEWYKDGETKYYYGADARRCSGLQIIEGKQYYFSEGDWLYTNTIVAAKDETYYYCDAEGIATELPKAGWVEMGGQRYYVKDGKVLKNCVEKIDDVYYAFDYNGKLRSEGFFNIWNAEREEDDCYRARPDGTLYVNEWYIPEDPYIAPRYYGEDAKAYKGLHTIDGKTYYFNGFYGELCRKRTITAEDGTRYYCDADGIATKLENNGWFEIDGEMHYVKDGDFLRSCVEKFDGFYYAFDSEGVLRTNESFSIWSKESGQEFYYRAKEDGTLYANEWYIPDSSYETPYYYGEDGKAYVGLREVDGVLYYFGPNGQRYEDRVITENGKCYYCKANGVTVELSEGWNQINGKRVYIKDGKILSSCVVKIDDNYYCFDNTGALYSNAQISLWNDEMGKMEFYRAKTDGSLYVNEWYETVSNKYYYGEGGKAANGFQTIEGKQYYFGENGSVYVDVAFSVNGKNYYCYKDGSIIELDKEGWNKVGVDYLYIQDGQVLKDCVVQINGAYYGFSDKGIMYRNCTFSNWDKDTNQNEYYWASSSGALYTNTWGGDYNNTYYYGADAKSCRGMQTIDGIRYIFKNNDGNLILSEATTLNNVNYYCNAEGEVIELPNNQWYKGDNGSWYYVQEGTLLRNCRVQIGGVWYEFDSYGKMQTQGLNVNEDGSLRINTWFYDGEHWHYYGDKGQMYAEGLFEIDGVKYYFTDGSMAASRIVTIYGKKYVADANGHLTILSANGWILVGNDYYYAEDGNLITNDIRKIDGAYYAFDNSGKMLVNGEYVCSLVTCRARANGSLYVSEWYQDLNGNWYYYGEDAGRVSGEAKVDGISYLFNSQGMLKRNGVVQMAGKYYLADENGVRIQASGWFWKDGWYYVQNDGSLYQGILKDGGYTYYMNPRMVTDSEMKVIDGIVYNIDASGHVSVAPDGFYHSDFLKNLYYIIDGKSTEKGWKEIDGNLYYFGKSNTADMYWAVSDGTYSIDNQYYLFNSDGTLALAGWQLDSKGTWYYVYASGVVATGDTMIDGTLYHFADDGKLKTGIIVEDGKCNLYNEDGVLIETGAAQGWNLIDGYYYYLSGDTLLKDGEYKLADGKWYYFNSQGIMIANALGDRRVHGESGAAQTGWFVYAGSWYYASAIDAKMYTGFHTINGVDYYFDRMGVMQTGQVVVEDKLLTIDDSGAIVATSAVQDGWSYYGNEWYYYQNGKPYTGWVGDYYVQDGQMCHNDIVSWQNKRYYLEKDGVYMRNAWYEGYLGSMYYAKADGTLAQSEWLEIAGKLYCFDEWGCAIRYENDYVTTENGVYETDGAYLSADGYPQGWSLINGTYYYKEGENFVFNQAKKINGDWYLFDVHGRMVTGFSSSDFDIRGWKHYTYDEGNFYYGADGRRCSYVGWQVIDGKWYYFDTASKAASGWQIINGVRYYFDAGYGTNKHAMVTGYRVINETLYYFDANGACQGVCGPRNGWYQAGENWYYMRKGHVVTGSIIINGIKYEFDDYGVWISE